MNRDEILAIVVKHVVEAGEGLNLGDIDPNRSMLDYDLPSLDIVEVVTRSMRVVNVKVPRTDLRKVDTINDLVDALHRAIQAKGQ